MTGVQTCALPIFNVFVAADCVSSRKRFDKEVALGRLQAKGVELLTVEAALYHIF